MKVLFASDMSFNYFENFPGEEKVEKFMAETAEEFKKADFSILNLENIFGEREGLTPIIKSAPKLISPVTFSAFVDVLNPTAVGLANNHSRDYGEEALFGTMELLKKKGYLTAGAGKNLDEAYEPAVFEKDGLRVAVIAVCENEPGIAEDDKSGSAGYNLYRVADSIKKSLARGEMPVIYFHGGNEYNPFPSPEKTQLYRHFIDLGAKAVIAMHTHCPQGYEMHNGCPIVYSMGNFFFPWGGERLPSWFYGYMSVLDFKENQIDIEIVPYRFDINGHYILHGEEKEFFMKYMDYLCGAIKDKKRIKEYFDSWSIMWGVKRLVPYLCYTDDLLKDAPTSIMRMKNVLCCEAHNEVVRNAFKIMYDGRIEEAGKFIPEIEKLQQMQL